MIEQLEQEIKDIMSMFSIIKGRMEPLFDSLVKKNYTENYRPQVEAYLIDMNELMA